MAKLSDPNTAEQITSPIMELLHLNFDAKPTEKASRKKRSERASNYMSSLYEQIEQDSDTLDADFWYQADRIVSSTPYNVKYISNTAELTFSLDDFVSDKELLLGAQLLVYAQTAQPIRVKLVGASESPELPSSLFGSTATLTSQNPASFNVTELLSRWIKRFVQPTLGIKFEAIDQPLSSLSLDSFIVAAFRDKNSVPLSRHERRRVKRQVEPIKQDPFTQAMHPNTECHKQGLYVDFAALKWKEWVIAPEGYAAYFCTGACSFPPHDKMNATSHAIVQTLIHTVRPNQTEAAKCAPRELGSMKILFTDNNRNVVMKRYKDMIVLNCGCH
ncbi:hypothetical protein WR25_09891 [Diploscapter pachys]|uniref:TGF-beta family profile domain-containing protein n=1 Tax=Diploscapter pachys TaxID=2018661 RepID=A0A2A2JC76_9BILA|nr:hypothetical protein WR25_09891 [Diploscapter pachys]